MTLVLERCCNDGLRSTREKSCPSWSLLGWAPPCSRRMCMCVQSLDSTTATIVSALGSIMHHRRGDSTSALVQFAPARVIPMWWPTYWSWSSCVQSNSSRVTTRRG